jgi:hypothetical protein
MYHFRQIRKELLISLTLWAYVHMCLTASPPQARKKVSPDVSRFRFVNTQARKF